MIILANQVCKAFAEPSEDPMLAQLSQFCMTMPCVVGFSAVNAGGGYLVPVLV